MRICLGAGMVCYADICALVSVRYAGRAGWRDGGEILAEIKAKG